MPDATKGNETEGGPTIPGLGRVVEFSNTVSFGSLLILLGMLGTGMAGIFTVGTSIQKMQDQIAREAEIRVAADTAQTERLQHVTEKEAADVVQLNVNLNQMREDMAGLRADVRTLIAKAMDGREPKQLNEPKP